MKYIGLKSQRELKKLRQLLRHYLHKPNNRLLFRGMNMDRLCPGATLSGIRQASMTGAGPLRQRELMELIEKIVKDQ